MRLCQRIKLNKKLYGKDTKNAAKNNIKQDLCAAAKSCFKARKTKK